MAFIPHTAEDIQDMLKKIGLNTLEDVFDEIPANIPKAELETLTNAMNEHELLTHAKELANKNINLTCFAGAGCYDHHIPAMIWDICTRGEFLTSYTPYQAEVSQGTLQVLYEFQTMLAELFALDVANASLYDGASALAEAILMAKRIQKDSPANTVLVPHLLHPEYKMVLKTLLSQQGIEILELPYDTNEAKTNIHKLNTVDIEKIFAVCIVQPNFFGVLEDVNTLTDWAHQHQFISIACVNPISLGMLSAPGTWGEFGVDIACAEGQVFGIPMAGGGPMLGLISCKKEYVRQLPGRVIGLTTDAHGNPGFVLTLQAREQHIRRGKATSNICTNQGLNVVAATIYMSLLGPQGLKKVALACYQNTHFLIQELCKIQGVNLVYHSPFFHEAVVAFNMPMDKLFNQFERAGILPGLNLSPYFPELKNCLLICATEIRSAHEINLYLDCVKSSMMQSQSNSHECQLGV